MYFNFRKPYFSDRFLKMTSKNEKSGKKTSIVNCFRLVSVKSVCGGNIVFRLHIL